ncbi:MAG: hypothetical protein IJW57_12260 [Spirochaetaceae bacterium]|nr:hypothetical protein [Spirochaetaceae bacterium]
MRRFQFVLAPLVVVLLVVFAVGCGNVTLKDTVDSMPVTYDEKVLELLEKTTVRLLDGVSQSDIGLTLEGRGAVLSTELSRRVGRNVSDTDVILSMEEMVGILDAEISKVEIPELMEPSEDDFVNINADFPGLSQDEIAENIDVIAQIYQDQVAALAVNSILDDSRIMSAVSRGAGDYYVTIKDETITLAEMMAVLKHPFSAIGLVKQKNKAYELTSQYMGSKESVNTKTDAFRHAIWNVVMAKEGWGKKSAKMAWARDFATAHEKGKKYVAKDSEMDLHNNAVGLSYYDRYSSRIYRKFLWWRWESGVNEPSYEQAGNYLKSKANSATFVDEKQSLDAVKKRISRASSDDLVYIRK